MEAENESIRVPSFVVDAVNATATAYTVHVLLGTSTPALTIVPQVHLVVGTSFARHLIRMLSEGVRLSEELARKMASAPVAVQETPTRSEPPEPGAPPPAGAKASAGT
jgi:hypothetical protein